MASVNHELIHKTRYHINRIEKQSELMENKKKWLQVTAALNVLEDTDCAITYYRETEYPNELNGKYLFTYGLLQALFVQEDAVNSINIALFDKKVDFETNYPGAFSVRNMRDDVVGHPTNRNNKAFIHLAQCSFSKNHFYYIKSENSDKSSSIHDVNIIMAISDVADCVNMVLTAAIERLDKEFREYIDKHKDRKMKNIFKSLVYAKEKVLTTDYMNGWGYDLTKEMVENCEKELCQRYGKIDAVDSYKYLLDDIHEIYDLVDNGIQKVPQEIRAGMKKYLLEHLFVKLEELESCCIETDQYFENYGEPPCEYSESIELPQIILEKDDDWSV